MNFLIVGKLYRFRYVQFVSYRNKTIKLMSSDPNTIKVPANSVSMLTSIESLNKDFSLLKFLIGIHEAEMMVLTKNIGLYLEEYHDDDKHLNKKT